MLEILWPVVDSQLASSDPLPEPPGPASGPACTGRAKVVTGYPKRLLPNACTTPAQALIDIAGLPPPHPRPPERHAIPSSRPAQAGLRPTLKSTLQRSAPHPARGAVQPLADPVWGPALRRRVRGRRGTQTEQVPANPVRAARLRPALCAYSVPAALPGAPAGRTSTRLSARLSAAPQRRRHTLQAKAAAVPGSPLAYGRQPSPGAFARREHSYRARRAAGSAEVDDQAQNVRWRNRPAATAQQCESLLDVAGQKPPGGGRRRSRLPAERSCPPGTDRLAPGLDLANLDQITPAARGSRCMPAAIGCTRGCDGPQGSGAAVPLTAGQLHGS